MPEKQFELGLVMAGAVSAGAYTAGVVDFLFKALDEYDALRHTAAWDGPTHAVRLPIMTGASAGGMTSAISALHAFRDLEPVRPGVAAPAPSRNRLYSSWVTDVSIERLLASSDLEGAKRQHGVLSALCCDVLDEIVDHAFLIDGAPKSRAWVGRGDASNLRVRLTLTNVRGVPYSFPIFGADQPQNYGMLNHADFYDFVVGPKAVAPDATALDSDRFHTADWDVFKTAALATGAFPVGLKPRLITRPDGLWYNQDGCVGYDDPDTQSFVNIRPDGGFAEAPYQFVSVDGGTIDNEPLELARRFLAGPGLHNDRNGDGADKAVVLIAPFPSFAQSPVFNGSMSLASLLPQLGNALIQQARFKPDELHLAANDKVFSRFMIAPSRAGGSSSPEAGKYPIACGAMGGFSGFLHESFRRHDYLLGRRNAQAFLRWHFALPESNDLFADANINGERWRVRDPSGQTGSIPPGGDMNLQAKTFAPKTDAPSIAKGFPIIPLSDRLCEPIVIGAEDMPRPELVSLAELKARVGQRAQTLAEVLVNVDLARFAASMNPIVAMALKQGAKFFGAHVITEAAMSQIAKARDELIAAFE